MSGFAVSASAVVPKMIRSVITAAMLIGGCGIPTDDTAETIRNPPADLVQPLPTNVTTTQPPSGVANRFILRLYWHTETGELRIVERSSATNFALPEALEQLTQGPDVSEQELDPSVILRPNFGDNLQPQSLGVNPEGVVRIRVADEADFRAEGDRRLAVSEIVCTAVQFLRVEAVEIVDSEGPIPLTDIEANPIAGPANASHYYGCEKPSVVLEEAPATSIQG